MTTITGADRRALVARIVLALVLLAVAAILLWPTRPATGAQNALEAWFERLHRRGLPTWLGFGSIEFLANVAMFVPLGFLTVLGWPGRQLWVPVTGWLLFSAAAELIQATLEADRVGDCRDVLANSIGALIGCLIARYLNSRKDQFRR